MAEFFRDEGRDVLLFIDNIYRFTLAGTEVSALLGRMPSAVGYQPTLAEEMGVLQERITSTKTGSITSIQAVYVPADDLTDPSPATTFGHLDATVVLSRDIAALYVELLAEAQRVVKAKITSATALDAAELAKLQAALKKRFGREVEVETALDPELLGGAVIDAGDIVIDGSLRNKLARLETALTY